MGANEVQSFGDFLCEGLFSGDELVGGRGDEAGLGIATGDAPSGPCGSRCGGELRGFGENVFGGKLRKLFANGVNVFGEGGNIDVFDRKEGGETLEGELKQCFPDAEEIDELLRLAFAAHRPETFSDSACEKDAIIVIGHSRRRCFVKANIQFRF